MSDSSFEVIQDHETDNFFLKTPHGDTIQIGFFDAERHSSGVSAETLYQEHLERIRD